MDSQLALLGEMTKIQGKLNLPKGSTQTISYAAQSPWLQRRTIKENILFGNRYDEQRYNDVVNCCALRPDLDILEDGDETLIGDRWVLSYVHVNCYSHYIIQGYKFVWWTESSVRYLPLLDRILIDKNHRVALARAVYANTKYVLLDDPLSSVVRVQNDPRVEYADAFTSPRTAGYNASCLNGCCVDLYFGIAQW